MDSTDVLVVNNYAVYLLREGRNLERALSVIEQGNRLLPENFTIHYYFYLAHQALGNEDMLPSILKKLYLYAENERDRELIENLLNESEPSGDI